MWAIAFVYCTFLYVPAMHMWGKTVGTIIFFPLTIVLSMIIVMINDGSSRDPFGAEEVKARRKAEGKPVVTTNFFAFVGLLYGLSVQIFPAVAFICLRRTDREREVGREYALLVGSSATMCFHYVVMYQFLRMLLIWLWSLFCDLVWWLLCALWGHIFSS